MSRYFPPAAVGVLANGLSKFASALHVGGDTNVSGSGNNAHPLNQFSVLANGLSKFAFTRNNRFPKQCKRQ